MKLKAHDQLLKLLRIPKHELHSVIKEHVEWRIENETTANLLANLKVWYKQFRKFLFQYDTRNVSLTNKGIGNAYLEWQQAKGYSNGYIKHNFKTFLATINRLGIYNDIKSRELFRGFVKTSRANEDYFLTNEEVKELLALKIEDSMLERVALDAFIVSCFTGCRVSEIVSVEAVDEDTLRYTSIKTKKHVLVPYNTVVKPYIESGHYKAPIARFRREQLNANLHDILKRLGWDEPVYKYRLLGKEKKPYAIPRYMAITFHSGRKFFGKMLLDMNVSMYKVSQLLGHSSIDTTQKYYAAVTRDKMMKETNKLINKF